VVNDAGGGSWLVVVGGLANSDGASKILGDVWVLSIVSPYSQMTCVRCPTLALRPICGFEDSGTQFALELSAASASPPDCVCGRWSQVAITTDPASGPPTPRVGAVLGVTGELMLAHATYNMQRTMAWCSASTIAQR
jgi:hypothetical protein